MSPIPIYRKLMKSREPLAPQQPIPSSPAGAPVRVPARLPQVASRGFFLAGADTAAIAAAEPFDGFDLNQNARVLWASAQALGLGDALRAERADQVRRQGGLLT
jgi:hypothetical protein